MVQKGVQKSKNKVSSQKAALSKKATKQSEEAVSNGTVSKTDMDVQEEQRSRGDQEKLNGAKENEAVNCETTPEAAAASSEEPQPGSSTAEAGSSHSDVASEETAAESKSQSKETEEEMKNQETQPSTTEEKPAPQTSRSRKRKGVEPVAEEETTTTEEEMKNQETQPSTTEEKPVPHTSRSRKRKGVEPPVAEVKSKERKVEESQEEDVAMAESGNTVQEPKQTRSLPLRKKLVAKAEVREVRSTRGRKAAAAAPIEAAIKVKGKSAKADKKPGVSVATKPQKAKLDIPAMKTVSGKVFVIGDNGVGQLGFSDDVDVKTRPALLDLPQAIVDVAAGGMHSVCLTVNGEVITFGCNDEGALGRITTDETQEFTPRRVEIGEKIIQVSAGDSHSAALAESGQIYIWGNFRSQDGPMGLLIEGIKQVKPVPILNGIKIVKVASGAEHLACLSNEGLVYTMGCGENGQLGRVPERKSADGGREGRAIFLEPTAVPLNSRSKPVLSQDIWCGSYSTFLKAQETNAIYAFGLNNYNHLGCRDRHEKNAEFFPVKIPSFSSRTWLQIAGGQHHTLALDSDNLVFALGRSDYGRLGLGENCEEKSVPTIVSTLENEKCLNISCGNCVSFAVSEDGSVYSWGMGTNHQLGHGNDDDCLVPHRIEGNFIKSWKVLKVSGGGQHTLLLAYPKENAKSEKK